MTLAWFMGTLSIPIPAASNKKGGKVKAKPPTLPTLFQTVVEYFCILLFRSLVLFPPPPLLLSIIQKG